MIKRKLFVVLTVFLILCTKETIKAQSIYPILLNEYSASNTGYPVDNFGQQSDWVEFRNAHTAPYSLSGSYLSNDRNNLQKWKIPPGFNMGVGTYSVVWLSGRNTVVNGNYHANFTLDQCKNQWLILTSADGVVRDCVFVQRAKAGHSWGRVDNATRGVSAWRLYTAHSFLYANPLGNNFLGYAPKPSIVVSPNSSAPPTSTAISAGGFCPIGNAPLIYFKLENPVLRYDTLFHPCYNVYYTINGSYPVPGAPTTFQVYDSTNPTIAIDKAIIIRAISVVNPTMTTCQQNYLPSFCETNTYFADDAYQNFDSNFGVVSIAIDPADTNWFNSSGNPPNIPIHVEYYDNKNQMTEGYGLINRPPNEAWKTAQKGYNITIDDKQGFGCNFEGKIFNVEGLGASSRTVFPTLHLDGGDIESHSAPLYGVGTPTTYGTGVRDVIMQSLSVKYNINVNPLHVKPVVVFRNGAYYGVYTLKEVYDKYYENYYHEQPLDQQDLAFYHNTDGYVSYNDGSVSRNSAINLFKTSVYDIVMTKPISNASFYKSVTNVFDVSSFHDWMILQSYALNSDMWNYNVAYAKGGLASKPGNKWHYYLWNMPASFNFTVIPNSTASYANPDFSACAIYASDYPISPVQAGNGHGAMMRSLMRPSPNGNAEFQTQYKNRYQDLLNTALKCDNILKHFDYVWDLYRKEMKYHEDPANLGRFSSAIDVWDTNMYNLRKVIARRCYAVANSFTVNNCYRMVGPYNITVNVEPEGAGSVKLNSIVLDSYPWYGSYYGEDAMSFRAIPSNTTFAFDHWEFKNNHVLNSRPLSMDSVAIGFGLAEEVTAVFTDKSRDLSLGGDSPNVPTGFTPNGNGDPANEIFKPLGPARYTSNYEMTIWNRWGQEVFRSLSPTDGWDGKYRGQDSPTGVYAYIIKYTNIYGEEKLLKGNVTLTR